MIFEELERSEDVNETATSLAQLVEKHGEQGWVDPLVEYMEPMVLLQLEDLGNLLEVLVKYVTLICLAIFQGMKVYDNGMVE
jgi:hypothetical protein